MKKVGQFLVFPWRVILVVLLGLFIFSHNLYAYDTEIHLNWDEHAKYQWLPDRAAMKFEFKIWDGNKNNDWVDYIDVYYGDDVVFQVDGSECGHHD